MGYAAKLGGKSGGGSGVSLAYNMDFSYPANSPETRFEIGFEPQLIIFKRSTATRDIANQTVFEVIGSTLPIYNNTRFVQMTTTISNGTITGATGYQFPYPGGRNLIVSYDSSGFTFGASTSNTLYASYICFGGIEI